MPYKSAAQRKAVWASRNEQAAKKKRKKNVKRKRNNYGIQTRNRTSRIGSIGNES